MARDPVPNHIIPELTITNTLTMKVFPILSLKTIPGKRLLRGRHMQTEELRRMTDFRLYAMVCWSITDMAEERQFHGQPSHTHHSERRDTFQTIL